MFTESREFRGRFPEKRVEHIITAEFHLPKQIDAIAAGIKIFPQCVKEHSFPPSKSSTDTQPKFKILSLKQLQTPEPQPFAIQIGFKALSWTLEADYYWFKNYSNNCNLIKGSIYFRSKFFRNWEPFEYLKYFTIDRKGAGHAFPKLVESIFTSELLAKSSPMNTLEMTLKLECILLGDEEEEEIVLSKQRAEMNNMLLPIRDKSDLRIKVGNEEFFAHMKHIKQFSAVSATLSRYVDKTNWDWSDIMTTYSMHALLRYIYYSEVDLMSTPEIAFHLLKFSHMYLQTALFKVCEKKLMSFGDNFYTLPHVLDMYMFFRISQEFIKLKTHFCGILSRNSKKYDTTKLKAMAQTYKSGLGVEALVEILQFEEPKPQERPNVRLNLS